MKNVIHLIRSILIMLSIFITISCNNNPHKNTGIDKDNEIESLDSLIRIDRKVFLSKLTSNLDSDFDKAQAIINWLAVNFDWKATDYKKRNVQEIINRGGGNCNDLAKVAINLMDSSSIKIRKVREINIHTKSNDRQISAETLVNEKGLKYSVFGRMHNDHVWIEIYDKSRNEWIPADPSLGLVGLNNWMESRVAFNKRKTLDPGSKDMVVPIAIFAHDENGNLNINRTEYYLIENFDEIYNHRLSNKSSWIEWCKRLKEIDDKCILAFEGKLSLHNHEAEIEALYTVYMDMKLDFESRK